MSEGGRCSREDWLETGLQTLVQNGHAALRVVSLARSLGVTKGSFYWHFENVGEFHSALLEHWHKRFISTATRDARNRSSSDHPLRTLTAILQDREMPAIDAAVRRWAVVNPKAAEAVRHSERFRRQRVVEMLRSQGVDQKTAEARAQLVIWAWRGSADEPNPRWRLKAMGELFGLIAS